MSATGVPKIMSYMQDVLVVTAPGSGAETIPFLKTWVNLPMAIGFTVIYAKVTLPSTCLDFTCAIVSSADTWTGLVPFDTLKSSQ